MSKGIYRLGICASILAVICAICGLAAGLPEARADALSAVLHQGSYVCYVCILWVLAGLLGLVYFFKGGVKKLAPLYKVSLWAFLFSVTANILYISANAARRDAVTWGIAGSIVCQMLLLVTFACVLLLAYAPNLGKKRSILLANLAVLSVLASSFFGAAAAGIGHGLIANGFAKGDLIIMIHLMVLAKYEDKDARGTV